MRSGSVHLAVATLLIRLLFSTNPAPLRELMLAQVEDEARPAAPLDDRVLYARMVAGGWVVLGVLCGLAMLALAAGGDAAGGASGRTAGLAVGLGAVFFCVAGALYASSRLLWAYRLRAAVRTHGPDSAPAVRAARKATLRNTSLVGQAVVAALTITLAV